MVFVGLTLLLQRVNPRILIVQYSSPYAAVNICNLTGETDSCG